MAIEITVGAYHNEILRSVIANARRFLLAASILKTPWQFSGSTVSAAGCNVSFVGWNEEAHDELVIFEHACKLRLEGIVSKRIDLPYDAYMPVRVSQYPGVP